MNTRIGIVGLLLALVLTACGAGRGASKTDGFAANGQEPIPFQELFFKGQRAKATGDYKKAFGFFEQASEISPQNDAVYYEMARVQQQMDAPLLALDYARKAADLDPENAWYHTMVADLNRQLGRIADMEAALEEVLKRDPKREDAYYGLLEAQLSQEAPKRALNTLERMESALGPNPDIYRNRANLHMALGDQDKATGALEDLVKAYPQFAEFHLILAEHYAAIGDTANAQRVFEHVASMDSDNGQLQLRLSEFLAAQGKDEASYQALTKAFSADDVNIDQKIGVMMKFYSLTELNPDYIAKAYNLLDLLKTAHPGEAKAHAMAGDFYIRDGALNEARSAYERALELDPSKGLIWQQLVTIDLEQNDMEALSTHASAARDLFPLQPEYYLYAGMAALQLDKPQEAIRNLNDGRLLVIDNPGLMAQFWSQLGDAYHSDAQHAKSDEAYEKALDIDPDNVFVLNNYAYYLALRGENLARAEDLAQRCNTLEPGQASFLDTLGWVYFKQGKYDEAITWLTKADEAVNGASGEILEHLGDAYFKSGNAAKALELWKKAAQLGDGSDALPQKIETGTLDD